MIWQLDVLLFAILLVAAFLALRVRDLLGAVALLAGYSLFAALLFAGMAAVDVALVEAALGAGVTGVLFIAAILTTTRHAAEQPRWHRRRLAIVPIAAFVVLMLWASVGLPDRGDPQAPAHQNLAPRYLTGSMEETETPNVVTSLLADYRSMDTFGETLVIFTAALAALLVLRGSRRPEAIGDDEQPPAPAGGDAAADEPSGGADGGTGDGR